MSSSIKNEIDIINQGKSKLATALTNVFGVPAKDLYDANGKLTTSGLRDKDDVLKRLIDWEVLVNAAGDKFVLKAGDTMTGTLTMKSDIVGPLTNLWINGMRSTTASDGSYLGSLVNYNTAGYYSLVHWKSKTGHVSISMHGSSNDKLYFSYMKDTTVASDSNTCDKQMTWDGSTGTLATATFQGNLDWSYITNKPTIPTKASWNYDDVYSKLGHTHSEYAAVSHGTHVTSATCLAVGSNVNASTIGTLKGNTISYVAGLITTTTSQYGALMQWCSNPARGVDDAQNDNWYFNLLGLTDGKLYFRNKTNGGTWSTWKTVSFEGHTHSFSAITDKTLVTASSVCTSNWSTYSSNHIPTMSFIAYWNGAYSGGNSNLSYCNLGAFGSATTHAHSDYVTGLSISGDTLAWSKGGTALTALTIPYATRSSYTGRDTFIQSPKGGVFSTSTSSYTGYLRIKMPCALVNTMMSFYVDIYDYAENQIATYKIAGYNYSGGWYNVSAQCVSSYQGNYCNLTVRFGLLDSKAAVSIGEANTTWSYPQVVVRDVLLGYSAGTIANYFDSWTIDISTTAITEKYYSTSTKKENTGIQARYAASAGSVAWTNVSGRPTSLPANGGNADTVDSEHASAFAHRTADNNLIAHGNEFTFAGDAYSGAIWLNYRCAGGATNGNITDYYFGNGKGGKIVYLSELATKANIYDDSGSYRQYLGKDGSSSAWVRTTSSGIIPYTSGGAGSGHCGLGTSSWYFSYAYIDNIYGYLNGNISGSSTSCTGNAATATMASDSDKIDGVHLSGLVRAECNQPYTNPNDIAKNMGGFMGMITGTAANGFPNNDGGWTHIINIPYNNVPNGSGNTSNYWCTQIANRAGLTTPYIRSRAGGNDITTGWTAWKRIAIAGEALPASDVYSWAKAANPSWLPLSGGNLTGDTTCNTYLKAAKGLCVTQTDGASGYGLSLYGANYAHYYGIIFGQTSWGGKHGSVTADWATYFTMDSTANRGWIFLKAVNTTSRTNVASISNDGIFTCTSSASILPGTYGARLSLNWTAGGARWDIYTDTSKNIMFNITNDAANAWLGIKLTVGSTGNITAAGAFYANSDIRYKDIIEYINPSINDIANLSLFNYKWKDREDNSIYTGSSAQDVERILPNLITENESGFKSLDYATLGTVASITTAKEVIKQLKRIEELENQIQILTEKLSKYVNSL